MAHRPNFDVVVIGASSGGLAALSNVLGALPATFPAPVVVQQHRYGSGHNMLAEIIARRTSLRATGARAGDHLSPSTVYVAPADQDLTIAVSRRVRLSKPTRGGGIRTSIDRLFCSAAEVFGGRALAVVLTGAGSDGAEGVRSILSRGGRVIIQDPATAEAAGMPLAAIANCASSLVLPLAEIGPAVTALVVGETPEG